MENETIMCPELVNDLIADIGLSTPEVKEATRNYCLDFLEIGGEITWGDMSWMANCFSTGYETAWLKLSLGKETINEIDEIIKNSGFDEGQGS